MVKRAGAAMARLESREAASAWLALLKATRLVSDSRQVSAGAATSPPKYLPALGSSTITATMMRGCWIGARPTNQARYFFCA